MILILVQAPAQHVIVDHQTHWYPPAYLEFIRGRKRIPRAERTSGGWRYEPREGVVHLLGYERLSLERHLMAMEAAGVATMVSSPALLGDVAHLEITLAAEITALLNEQAAAAQLAHPGRFVGAAMAPIQDPSLAVRALEQAHANGLRALCVVANADGHVIATPDTLAIYRRADELGIVLFLHPAERSSAAGLTRHRPIEVGVNWMWDTSVAALSLVYGGVLDACPGLTVVHPHLGGVVPYLVGRIAGFERFDPTATGAERPVEEYLRERFYVDSINPTPGALALAARLYGADRILFASDAPFVDRGFALDLVGKGLAAADAHRVLHANRVPGLI